MGSCLDGLPAELNQCFLSLNTPTWTPTLVPRSGIGLRAPGGVTPHSDNDPARPVLFYFACNTFEKTSISFSKPVIYRGGKDMKM